MADVPPKPSEPCQWCDLVHGKICPYVKALEFDIAGNVTRVEFLTAADVKPVAPKKEEEEQPDYPRLGGKSA